MRKVAVLLGLMIATTAAAAPKAKGPAAETPESVALRIEAKWGKTSPAAVGARRLLAEEQRATARWFQTAIGPVAVVEGAALLVIVPSGKPHWWIGDSERYETPEGEAVAGQDGVQLSLATARDVEQHADGMKQWKFAPVSPAPQLGGKGVRKDRVDLVFNYARPIDRIEVLKFISVTRDGVLWDEEPVRAGFALIDLDGDVHADRARREHQNFAECIMNVCDAVWYEFDRADGKGGFQPAPAAVAKSAYRKLVTVLQARLETETDCARWRDGAFVLYRYALLGGIEVKDARAWLDKRANDPKRAECRNCPELSAAETQAGRREAEACHRSSEVLTCLGKAEPLTQTAFETCLK